MSNTKKHRGRIQAQGGGLEESESWAQDDPLTAKKGLQLLGLLKRKIPKSECDLREKEFQKAEKLIRRIEQGGGIDAKFSRSFRTKGTKDVRVDIEVLSGRAFVAILILIFVLYCLW